MRGALGLAGGALALCLGLVACGGDAQEPAETGGLTAEEEGKAARLLERAKREGSEERLRLVIERFSGTQAEGEARLVLGELLVKDAAQALESGEIDRADERAMEAKIYGDLAVTDRAQALLDQVDDQRAERVSKDAIESASAGKCASALKRVGGTLGQKARARYRTQVHAASRDAIVKCLAEKIEEEVSARNIEGARSLLETTDVKVGLDKEGQAAIQLALMKHIVRQSLTTVEPLLARFEWEPAIQEIDRLRADDTLGKEEYEAAFALVQDAILACLVRRADEALTEKRPSEVYQELTRAEKLARWQQTPPELTRPYALLKVAIACEEASCKWVKPKARWSWGKVTLAEPSDPLQLTDRFTSHAQRVWVIAEAKGTQLVALEDPGSAQGAALLGAARGWASSDLLKSSDTELWLPPVDQLPGTRVWAPLRPPKKDYHLGTVREVVGTSEVVVKRMADDEPITVSLKDLRVGTLKSGLKVMAFCVDQLTPERAQIDRVVTAAGGVPKVNVICDRERKERVEVAGALTTQATWLPPRRP
ncbi:MAG: hypothetical protein KF915_12910 [Polyangiaceae bacterium]|nr:hypothetical protein [Polyangiaceae bacterium]